MCGLDEKCQVLIRNLNVYAWKTYLKRKHLLSERHMIRSVRGGIYISIFLQYCVD